MIAPMIASAATTEIAPIQPIFVVITNSTPNVARLRANKVAHGVGFRISRESSGGTAPV